MAHVCTVTGCDYPVGGCAGTCNARVTTTKRPEPYTDRSPADVGREALAKIAELETRIECTSLREWCRKAKAIAAKALEDMK